MRRVFDHRWSQRSIVEVVRVDIEPGEEGERCAVLDVMLRNTGPAPAVVHELVIDDITLWSFPRSVRPSALAVTGSYEIDLGVSARQTVRLAQQVEPGQADRFVVRLGTSEAIFPFVGGFLYLFSACLIVDGPRRAVQLGRFLARVPQPMRVHGYHGVRGPDPRLDELVAKAVELEQILTTGVYVQPGAQAVLNELIRRDPDAGPSED